MTPLRLSLAVGDYDRTRALFDGRVTPAGTDLTTIPVPSAETFVRMLQYEEFDAAEMSLGAYASLVSRGDERFVGIPVFPSRMFRHRDIFVSSGSGISHPSELSERRVGIRRYHMTALVSQRGTLSDEHGIRPDQIKWVRAGIERAGAIPSRVALRLPAGVRIDKVTDRTIDDMLISGELHAGLLNFSPPSFRRGDPRIRRLFTNPREVENEYWRRTGIFPIMHLVVVHRRVHDHAPWVAQSLMHAFEQSKNLALSRLLHTGGTSLRCFPSSTSTPKMRYKPLATG
ncbi:MAG: ABC transporter substrate-binding protein, partial [Acidimicrobiia bacterium]|nr:ABC transporter substrate-binding protein [Acidimicrobiia bacterium]